MPDDNTHTPYCWSQRYHAGCLCEKAGERITEEQYEATSLSARPPRAQGREADLTDLVIVLARALGASNAPYKIPRGLFEAAREHALIVIADPRTGDIDLEVTRR